jgi:hypothetical protein
MLRQWVSELSVGDQRTHTTFASASRPPSMQTARLTQQERVQLVNAELERRPTSTGVRVLTPSRLYRRR